LRVARAGAALAHTRTAWNKGAAATTADLPPHESTMNHTIAEIAHATGLMAVDLPAPTH